MFFLKKKIKLLVENYLDNYIKKYIEENTLIQYLVFGDRSRLTIADTAIVNNALFNLSSGEIVIEDYVFFGHNVTLLTGTHNYEKFDLERQTSIPQVGRDVIVKRGAWIASNVTIIAPCIIGEHAVIAAGSLVKSDIPPYTIVAGIPAKIIKKISHPNNYRKIGD